MAIRFHSTLNRIDVYDGDTLKASFPTSNTVVRARRNEVLMVSGSEQMVVPVEHLDEMYSEVNDAVQQICLGLDDIIGYVEAASGYQVDRTQPIEKVYFTEDLFDQFNDVSVPSDVIFCADVNLAKLDTSEITFFIRRGLQGAQQSNTSIRIAASGSTLPYASTLKNVVFSFFSGGHNGLSGYGYKFKVILPAS